MGTFLLRRAIHTIGVLFLSSIVVFAIMRLLPGDPALAYAGPDASVATIEAIRERFALNEPLVVQYWVWASSAFGGDFGISYHSGEAVSAIVGRALAPTLELAIGALVVALVIGVTLGAFAGLRPRSLVDRFVQTYSSIAMGVPNFWLGIMFLLFFSLYLGWLPTGGRVSFLDDPLRATMHLLMPSFALGIRTSGVLARFVRGSLIDVMRSDYIRTAKSIGLSSRRILRHYAAPNATIPPLTIAGITFGRLLGGAVVIEEVFTWPGIGRTILRAIDFRDYAVVQASIALIVVVVLLVNLLVDIAYSMIDPRIRVED